MSREIRFVDITVDKIIRQTPKAFLFRVEGEDVWVAKQHVENSEEIEAELDEPPYRRKGIDTIEVPRWLAAENGWVDRE